MPITRLNHAVLYVRDVERSVAFYRDVLGFRVLNMLPEGFRGAAEIRSPARVRTRSPTPWRMPSGPRR